MVEILTELGLCATAFALAFFVGWERHWSHRPAGLRTFPIVGLASCVFVLVGQSAFPDDPSSQARVIQGLMTGIGFIGGGAILKDVSDETGTVQGIATAASIWGTGAIGAAVAYRRFDLAILLALVNFLILRFLQPVAEAATDAAGLEPPEEEEGG